MALGHWELQCEVAATDADGMKRVSLLLAMVLLLEQMQETGLLSEERAAAGINLEQRAEDTGNSYQERKQER